MRNKIISYMRLLIWISCECTDVSLIIYGRWHSWSTSNYSNRVSLCELWSHLTTTSHLQLTSWVTWHGFLPFCKWHDLCKYSYLRDRIKHLEYTHSYMQGYASHALIRSICMWLPFVSVNNNTCWSIVNRHRIDGTLWLLGRLCLGWSSFHLILKVCR